MTTAELSSRGVPAQGCQRTIPLAPAVRYRSSQGILIIMRRIGTIEQFLGGIGETIHDYVDEEEEIFTY